MGKDHQLLHLSFAQPENADVNSIEEHNVCRKRDEPSDPSRLRLILKDVSPKSTHVANIKRAEITSKKRSNWISKTVLPVLVVEDMRINSLSWELDVPIFFATPPGG